MSAIMVIGAFAIFIQSCEVNDSSKDSMSSNTQSGDGSGGGDGSSLMSGNCMNCHNPNGPGEGTFTVGGTVFDSTQTVRNPNAIVKLYTQPRGGGVLVATLNTDASGNFYTTSPVDFSKGLYPVVVSKISGKTQSMPAATYSGACNSCHGISNAAIWVN